MCCPLCSTAAVLIRRLDLRRAVIGKGRVKQLAGPIHRNTVIFRNSWLRKQVSLPHPRTPIARHRQLLQKIVMAEVEVAEAKKWSATNADEEEDPANKLYLLRQRR